MDPSSDFELCLCGAYKAVTENISSDAISKKQYKKSFLHVAATNDMMPFSRLEQFQKQFKGDINPRNKCGCTPLHNAALFGHFEICKFILINAEEKNPANDLGKLLSIMPHAKVICLHVRS